MKPHNLTSCTAAIRQLTNFLFFLAISPEPDFVGSYDIGQYVFFFFRETAVEYINCGKSIFSRVARVCKKDTGGKNILNHNWATYLKARLNCSIPGEYPFYFNEIREYHILCAFDGRKLAREVTARSTAFLLTLQNHRNFFFNSSRLLTTSTLLRYFDTPYVLIHNHLLFFYETNLGRVYLRMETK